MTRMPRLLIFCLLLVAGCGVKGDLRHQGTPDPLPPAAVRIAQQGDALLMQWRIPTGNQDGTPLTDLAGFRVDLYSYPPDRYCEECRDQETVATIRLEDPAPAIVRSGSVFFRHAELEPDRGYRYRITPFTASGRSGPSVALRQSTVVAPPAPVNTRAEELDRGIRLFWTIPDETQQAGELLGVNIYRSESGPLLDPVPVNSAPVKGNNFEDFGLKNGTTYRYGLRAVVRSGERVVESALGEIVAATPRAGL